jgi:hypothetical protein
VREAGATARVAPRGRQEQNLLMTRIMALPARGEVFLDARDEGRAMRMSWHHEGELVVFSVWREHTCVATFQLGKDDVPRLIESLVSGLIEGYRGRSAGPAQAV